MLDSGGLQPAWIGTGTGLVFTFGGLMGISAFITGVFVAKRTADRMGKLQAQLARDGQPTQEQRAELGRLGRRLDLAGRITFGLMLAALFAMATARYISF